MFGRHIDRGRVIEDPGDCNTWEQRWRDDVAAMDPDVVAILLGRWEMTDRRYAGAWRHLGDPVFDGYVASQLDRAIAIGAARGARVVMVAPPCLQDAERPDGGSWPQDDPARLERFDELLRAAAAHHPALVRMMDLSAWVCPDGRFQRDIDGRDIRDPDGVHFTVAGARYVGRLLLPTLYEVARQRPPLTALSGRKRPPGS